MDELKPRDQVVDAQLGSGSAEFLIVLSGAMAEEAGKHVELYHKKGLLTRVDGADAVAAYPRQRLRRARRRRGGGADGGL